MTTFDGFEDRVVPVGGSTIFTRSGGSGPPVLLLHGFPQTHRMWRGVAERLAADYKVVCADLRGYGRSGVPASDETHAPYGKRVMAAEMVAVMAALGHPRFHVVGHDRGGRVAFRMALDHSEAVRSLSVLDVIPTLDAWEAADARLALSFWPWSLLAQAEPLPERLIGADPEAVIDDALSQWGTPPSAFAADDRADYLATLREPARVHAICEEYRAAAGIDRDEEQEARGADRRLSCPVLVLWAENGGLNCWYDDISGPNGVWRRWTERVDGAAMPGGHFFAEAWPAQTADLLRRFIAAA